MTQTPRRLSAHVLEGLERRVASQNVGTAKASLLQDNYELRAVARDLISHIKALELEQTARMGVDKHGNTTHPGRQG